VSAPWAVEETGACFIVRDTQGQFARFGDIRLNSDSTEPLDEKRIERLSQRESRFAWRSASAFMKACARPECRRNKRQYLSSC
jgi:hypothetical protein